MESVVKILDQVRLISEGGNSGAAITILFIILVAGVVYAFVKQSNKHNTFIKDCNKAVRLEFNTSINTPLTAVASPLFWKVDTYDRTSPA